MADAKSEESEEKCAKIFDYASHMFSIVCRSVLSDLEHDVASRSNTTTNKALAQTNPGISIYDIDNSFFFTLSNMRFSSSLKK